jgi:hypothetical protein
VRVDQCGRPVSGIGVPLAVIDRATILEPTMNSAASGIRSGCVKGKEFRGVVAAGFRIRQV